MLRLMLASRIARLAQDHANHRSLHTGVVPRIGGLGIIAGVVLALAVAGPGPWPDALRGLGVAVAMLLAVSLADDIRGLGAGPRLLAHLTCAAALCASWGIAPAWIVVAAPGIAWGANLYNFMDGSDGLAGSMAVSGFGALGIAAGLADAPTIAALSAAIAGAALGFLTLNWHPARVFLGDAGSIPLGFTAAALSLHGALAGHWPPVLPMIAFLPFVLDASLTLARRALRGERLSEPHREHLYQRLALAGHGHRKVALGAVGLMASCAIAALSTLTLGPTGQWGMFAAALTLNLSLWFALDRRLQRRPS
ncbi:MAG: hypothetical protein RIS35_2044, partial [Pseudomonadota bacterium]